MLLALLAACTPTESNITQLYPSLVVSPGEVNFGEVVVDYRRFRGTNPVPALVLLKLHLQPRNRAVRRLLFLRTALRPPLPRGRGGEHGRRHRCAEAELGKIMGERIF